MWFEQLTGFKEENPEQVRANLEIKGDKLISKVNNAAFTFGQLEIPSLEKIRKRELLNNYNDCIKISEVVADVQNCILHQKIMELPFKLHLSLTYWK